MTPRECIFNLSQFYRVNIRNAVNANELGLNGMHVRCLHVIANTPACTANSLVKGMGKDKAQIARLIKDMIAKGWIEKHASREDRRSQILTLSDNGRELHNKISVIEEELESTVLQGLSDREVAEFLRIAEKMLANLANK